MSKMFATKGAASKWARETETGLEKGDIHNLNNKNLSNLIDRYLEEIPEAIAYEKIVLEFWKEHLGKIKLSQVRKAHVIEARKKLRKQKVKTGPNKGGPLSNSTINRRVALLSRACAIAVEDNERDRLLTDDERRALASAMETHTEQSLLGFVLIAEATGMRAGEIRNLLQCNIYCFATQLFRPLICNATTVASSGNLPA